MVENILEAFICYPISMMYEKSELENLQILRRMFAVIEQRKTFWIIVGLTCGLGNMISLKPSLFMVQLYVFEHLIATLLSFVVSLLTCHHSVKRISWNKNMNGCFEWSSAPLRGGLWTKLSSIHSFVIRLCSSLKQNEDWKSPKV